MVGDAGRVRPGGSQELGGGAGAGAAGVVTEPRFAIGQRALLVISSGGNVLWDCVNYIDQATVAQLEAWGGVQAIAMSHPHTYASVAEWGRAFGAPVYMPWAAREWLMRLDFPIRYWKGSVEVAPGVTLVQCGGHFAGSAVLHWADGAGGAGAFSRGAP